MLEKNKINITMLENNKINITMLENNKINITMLIPGKRLARSGKLDNNYYNAHPRNEYAISFDVKDGFFSWIWINILQNLTRFYENILKGT